MEILLQQNKEKNYLQQLSLQYLERIWYIKTSVSGATPNTTPFTAFGVWNFSGKE